MEPTRKQSSIAAEEKAKSKTGKTKQKRKDDEQVEVENFAGNESRPLTYIDYPTKRTVEVGDSIKESQLTNGVAFVLYYLDSAEIHPRKKSKNSIVSTKMLYDVIGVFGRSFFIDEPKFKQPFAVLSFRTEGVLIGGILPMGVIHFDDVKQPLIQELTQKAIGKIVTNLFFDGLIGTEVKFNTFHPIHVPAIQINAAYRGQHFGLFTVSKPVDQANLETVQDILYPDIKDFKSGLITEMPALLYEIPEHRKDLVGNLIESTVQSILDEIKSKKKGYADNLEIEDVLNSLVTISVTIGRKSNK